MKKLDPTRNPMDRMRFIIAGIGVLTAGALIFNLLPLVLGVIADALLLEPHQIGLLGGVYMFGFAFSSLPAIYAIESLNWRWVMALCSLVVAICLVAASRVGAYPFVFAAFLVIGIAKGTIFGLGNRVLGTTSDPDRLVGIGYFVELTIPAILLVLFGSLVIPAWGHVGVLITTALVILALGATSAPLLPADAESVAVDRRQPKERLSSDIVHGLLALVCFFIGAAGLWAFVERMGIGKGIGQSTIGTILSIGLVVTAFASLIPMLTEQKVRRSTMLLTMSILAGVSMYLLDTKHDTFWYFVAVNMFNIAWGAAIVYITAVIADADVTGRFLVLISGAAGIGSALGPAVAGFLVNGNSYFKVFVMAMSAFLLSALFARLSERAKASQSP